MSQAQLAHGPLDRLSEMRKLDTLGMAKLLKNFSKQVQDGIRIGESFKTPRTLGASIDKIVFAGLGGSAIGGDVIRSLACEIPVPMVVSRHYDLPFFAGKKTLGIFSSYSGNTEETLSAFRQGVKGGVKSVVITSGGELAELAQRSSVPWIRIPKGLPPRSALGYSVFPLLKLFADLKLWKWDNRGIAETVSLLAELSQKKFAPEIPFSSNPAKQLAKTLAGKFVVIYAGTELLDSAALRFRNQIEENAKAMASHHLLPEMNHNEILGWQFPEKVIPQCACVFLRDAGDHPRIQLRIKITKELIAKRGVPVLEIHSEGKSRLARLFSAIHLGDWVSFYLAILYKMDPTPVSIIEYLKGELVKTKEGLNGNP